MRNLAPQDGLIELQRIAKMKIFSHQNVRPLGFVLAWMLALTGCSELTERSQLRQGMLAVDISEQAFKEEWGRPTRVAALSGDEVISTKKGGEGRLYFRGSKIYEVWEYDSRQVTLIFSDRKLVAWKTDQTVEQIARHHPLAKAEAEAE